MNIRDYSPIVASFLHQVTKREWKIARVIDCCGQNILLKEKTAREAKEKAKEEIMAGEESSVVFLKPNEKGENMRIVALIILGNEPDELVADWSYTSEKANEDFNIAWDAFQQLWEGKEVPTIKA